MEKISDGYYYEVFDLRNGKVLKKKKSFLKIAESIKGKSDVGSLTKFYQTWKHIHECERTTKKVIHKSHIPLELLGNPLFINSTDYEQNKVVLLMDYFESHTLEENTKIVDAYIDLVKELLRYGVHDNVYKFKNSYGITEGGKVVCIDFNEMVFSKNEVIKLAKSEQWRTQAQFTKFKEGELKNYLALKYREALKPELVDALWNTSRKQF